MKNDPVQEKIAECFNEVKGYLIFGAPNKKPMSESSETLARATFCQFFAEFLDLDINIDFLKSIVLYSIFARLYKYGDCIIQASYSFLQLINLNLGKSLRIVKMKGVSQGKPAFHAFVIIGLKEEINIENIASYNNDAIIFDTWGAPEILHCDGDLRKKLTLIAEFDNENFSIINFYRNDAGEFNEQERNLINIFLESLKNYLWFIKMASAFRKVIQDPNFFKMPEENFKKFSQIAPIINRVNALDEAFIITEEKFSKNQHQIFKQRGETKSYRRFF